MMFPKFGALAILTLCFLVRRSVQQECVPQGVADLRVTANQSLVWSPNPHEECIINIYLVHIFAPDQPYEHSRSVNETHLDISFLEICDEWTFVVVPVAGHTTGSQRRLVAKVPLPIDADLSLTNLTFKHDTYTETTHVHWDLNQTGLPNCSLQYRVTVEKYDYPVIESFLVQTNSLDLKFLSFCATYQFGVRAINVAIPTIEGPATATFAYIPGRRQFPPIAHNIESGTSWISFSVTLESELRNPCIVHYLLIEGTIPERIHIDLSEHDRSQPINVTITGLRPDIFYTTILYVFNSVGLSDARVYNFHTAESDPTTTPESGSTETKISK